MKRLILVIALGAGLFGIILAQPKKDTKKSNAPKEDIKVNKKFDEQGNLIQYDSTYTYNWSSDTTLTNHLSAEDFQKFFGGNFSFSNDSTMTGHSFFDDFDRMFSDHFGMIPDSGFAKKFGSRHFHSFNFGNDSTQQELPDFSDFFGFNFPGKADSISARSGNDKSPAAPHSMNEIMQMMQQQMKQMEEMHRKFFEDRQNSGNHMNLKEF